MSVPIRRTLFLAAMIFALLVVAWAVYVIDFNYGGRGAVACRPQFHETTLPNPSLVPDNSESGRGSFRIAQLQRIDAESRHPAISYSPDGQFLAVGVDSELRLYDQDARLVVVMSLPTVLNIWSIAFNPVLPQIVIDAGDHFVLMDTRDFSVMKSIEFSSSIADLSFTVKGDELLVATHGDPGIAIYHTASSDESGRVPYKHYADSVSVSRVTNCIVVAERFGGTSAGAQNVVLIDLNTGVSQAFPREYFNGTIRKVLFDPTGNRIASFDRGIHFWNVETMHNYSTFVEYYDGIWWSDTNLFVAVKSDLQQEDRQHIVLLDSVTGEVFTSVTVDMARGSDIVVDPLRNRFAMASADGEVIILGIETLE